MIAALATPRRIAFGVDLLTAVVIVSLAVAAAGLTWRLTGESGQPAAAMAAATPAAGAGQVDPGPVDLGPILALAPFGRAAAGDAPATSLGIALKGVMATQPASRSSALIAIGTAPPKAFTVGQSVAGATIEAIERDRVLLRVNGRAESLAFPRAPAPTMPAAPATAPVTAEPPAGTPPPAAPSAGGSLIDALGAARTDQGYRVGTSPPPALTRAGLIPGDVIERINDVAVGDADHDRQMLLAAAAGGPMRVTMLRGGKRLTVSVSLR
ncbi:type II secretion system protein N [Sphingomonas profundi]|uniref:type II secretion system protein N n=1 Tax=Alterirhizorhabdus profundi TaxID=2681549 RepID=UPI001E578A58|nr:type II secretion system protein N [Sphingomonas profundi]